MQNVSFLEALTITLVSMIVVFLILITISYAIGVLKGFSKNNLEEEQLNSNIVKDSKKEINYDEEIVAVIAGALATSMGVDNPHIRISKIRRLENSTWNNAAKLEQIN